MRNQFLSAIAVLLLFSCGKNSTSNEVVVSDIGQLNRAISITTAGDEIVLANGVWKDVQIKFYGIGTEKSPITLRAETSGEVFIEGQSSLHLGGEYLVVDGLHFRNGYSPGRGIIRYQIGKDSTAFHSQVTNCVIEDFSRPNRWENDRWIEFYGKHNQLDHCYITGKANDGATLMVYHKGNQHTNNYHQIVHNYFGPRPRKGGPRAETMRLGGSETSMTPGRANVSNNYFEKCNGEVEIISDKTNYNTFTNNIFYKCEGSLVMRHGNYTTVDGNMFIGDDDSDFYGGIRAVNTGHWITNNYFYKIRGEQFRSPLAMMNGIPKSSLNRYKQVTDVVVAHNTWVDCKSPFQIGVGQNKASADVLPKSEIRSAPPIRSTIANNLIYNTKVDPSPVVNHDDMDGILFKNNVIDNANQPYSEFDVLQNAQVKMKQVNDWLFVPAAGQEEALNATYQGYDFDKIEKGLFGGARSGKNWVGAVTDLSAADAFKIDEKQYGPNWFAPNKVAAAPSVITTSSAAGELARSIAKAKAGDIIELTDEAYNISSALQIDKEITLRATGEQSAKLVFTGAENTPAFSMNAKGKLHLENVAIESQNNQMAFAPLSENMSSAYQLNIENCTIENFSHVLKATKGSFADSLNFSNTTIQNCANGFVLAADQKGDYNAAMIFIDGCTFDNVQQNVIHYYRGGYDESTIGGSLTVTNSTFTNCAKKEASGILIKTRGILNVLLEGNTFQNNPIKMVALLWGEKNNQHRDNTVVRSGEIKVEQQQKQEILY
ncbi:MAG: chondroitinase-B domain-containing protein [Saprospiraceae bacterium]